MIINYRLIKVVLLSLFMLNVTSLFSQTYLMPQNGDTTYTVCGGVLKDDGNNANHSDNANGQVTLIPSNPGTYLSLNFTAVNLESCCDRLYIYSGTSVNPSKLIGIYYTSPFTVISDDPTGALTVVFTSDEVTNYAGFSANISCLTCSTPELNIMNLSVGTSDTVPDGRSFNVTATVNNDGFNSVISTASYDLSTTPNFSGYVTSFGYATVSAINAVSTTNVTKNVTIPFGTPPGDYFILMYSDANFDNEECDEFNNQDAVPITIIPSFVDLDITSIALTPIAAYPGYFNNGVAIGGTISIKNIGNTNYSGNGTCKVWFSSDSILGPNDILVTTNNSSINYGATSNMSFNYTPPFNLNPDTYYFIFEADGNHLFSEPDEINNFGFLPIVIEDAYHDLEAVSINNVPASFNFINSNSIQVSIRNKGRINTSTTYPFEYQLILSSDSIYDVNDIVLKRNSTTSATVINNVTNYTFTFSFEDINLLPGPAYLILFVDSEERYSETDESNNTTFVPIVYPTVSFDDTPTNLNVATQLPLGANFTISSTVKNNGTYKKAGTSISYYISIDTTFDSSDILLGSQSSTANANPSATYTLSNISVMLPPMITPGSYYILGISDADNNLVETNEANNKIIKPVTVNNFLPDVKINSISAPNTLCSNGKNNISFIIANSGNVVASNFNVALYLSTDTIYDGNDIVIYTANYSNLNEGATATISPNDYPISSTYFSGANYLLATVNQNNVINEYSLLNNYRYKTANVSNCSIDLIAQNGNANNANQGAQASLSFSIYNDGLASASGINYGYYVSTDNNLDPSDFLVYSGSTGLLHDNQSQNTSYNYTIPMSMTPGTYYAFFVVDTNNLFSETNETNNIDSDPFTVTIPNVGPDLIVQSAVLNSSTIGAGNYGGGGTVVLRNNGTTTATSSNVGIYLSTNNTYSANDIFIGSFPGGSINSNSNLNLGAGYEFQIPAGTTPGSYYLLYYIDYDSLITEYDETNNVYAKSVNIILADNDVKIILDLFPGDTIYSGNQNTYSSYLKNLGNCAYFHPSIKYYLSTDSIPDNNDIVLTGYQGYQLTAGSSSNPSNNITISNTIPDGNYYFIYHVDTDSLLSETNELNNIIAKPIYLKKPYADLELQNLSFVTSYQLASMVTYNVTFHTGVRNIGETAASSSAVRFYISTDTIIDTGDYILGTSSGSSLNVASTYTSRSISNISNILLPPGNYYMIHFVDPNNTVVELDETNNIRYHPIEILPQFIDLVSQNNTFNYDTLPQGFLVPITSGIYNNGTLNSANTDLRIVFSTDTIYDVSDILLYGNAYNQVNHEAGYTVSPNITIPNSALGDYYILVVADPDNDQSESNENNNVLYYPLHVIPKTYEFFTNFESISNDTLKGGSTYTCGGVIFNSGNSPASNILLKAYLSTDTIYSASDELLTNSGHSISAITGNQFSTNFVFPGGFASGNYFIIFHADQTNLYSEIDETNNFEHIPVYVKADEIDLFINHYYNSSPFIPGASTSIYFNTINNGNLTSGNYFVSAYLSPDSLISTSPNYSLGQIAMPSLTNYGISNSTPLNVSSFPSVPAGNYHLILITDSGNTNIESDENNNTSIVAVQVFEPEIDLIPFSLNAPTQAYLFSTISVNYRYNYDSPFSNLVNGKFYLSQDSTFDGSDIYLDQFSATATSGINSSSINLSIPGSIVTNFYYLLFVLDESNTVVETNELNNVLATPIYIEHNFIYNFGILNNQSITTCAGTIYDYGGPDEPYFNATNSRMVINPGTSSSKVKLNFLYFVNDGCCDYLKIFNGPDTLSPLIGTYTSNPGVVVSSHSSGSLTLLLKSDSANVASGFAANISCVVPGVDLIVDNVIINPDTINDNTTTNVEFDILNNGIDPSVATDAKIFISNDTILDLSDLLLATVPVSPIAGLSSDHYNQNITPNVTMSGMYHILVYVDHDQLIGETVENNNMDWNYLYIQNADTTFDISLGSCSISSSNIPRGSYFDTDVELINNFTTVGSHHFKVYLSVDTLVSGSDLILDDYTVAGITGSSSVNFTRNILIPGTVGVGSYYIILLEDADNDYVEINEINNKIYYAVNILPANDINELSNENHFSLFPNPANDLVSIKYLGNENLEHQNIAFYDVAGKLVYEISNQIIQRNSIFTINTSSFANGIYYIQIGSIFKTNPLRIVVMH